MAITSARQLEQIKERKKKIQAMGLCANCGKARSERSKWYCVDCLHKNNMRVQEFREMTDKQRQDRRDYWERKRIFKERLKAYEQKLKVIIFGEK